MNQSVAASSMVLWSWERRENLEFIDPSKIAPKKISVAPLVLTIQINASNELLLKPRLNHLKVPSGIVIIPVFRLEIEPQILSETIIDKLVHVIMSMSKKDQLIQLDFDARYSQRELYKKIIDKLRAQNLRISITALASYCTYDNWLNELNIEYAIPMIYGGIKNDPDLKLIKNLFKKQQKWPVDKCKNYIGLLIGEEIEVPDSYTIFYFNNKAWNYDSYQNLIIKNKL